MEGRRKSRERKKSLEKWTKLTAVEMLEWGRVEETLTQRMEREMGLKLR